MYIIVATWTYLGLSTPLKHFLEDIIVFFSCFFRGYVHGSTNLRYSPSLEGTPGTEKNHFSRAPKNTPKTHFRRHFGVVWGGLEHFRGGLDVLNATFHDFRTPNHEKTPRNSLFLDSGPNHEKTPLNSLSEAFPGILGLPSQTSSFTVGF